MPLSLHFQVSIGTSSKEDEGIGLSGIGSDNFRKHQLRLFNPPFSIHLTIEGGWRIASENRIKDRIGISLETYRNFTASLTSISILSCAHCESRFSSIDMIRVEDRSTDFWFLGIIMEKWLLYRWNIRNNEVVSKLLCPTQSFGCASMTLRKKETEERIKIRWSIGRLYWVHFKLCQSYKNSLTIWKQSH